jgi:hypothetical protein
MKLISLHLRGECGGPSTAFSRGVLGFGTRKPPEVINMAAIIQVLAQAPVPHGLTL